MLVATAWVVGLLCLIGGMVVVADGLAGVLSVEDRRLLAVADGLGGGVVTVTLVSVMATPGVDGKSFALRMPRRKAS
jgi:hypothetical protein